MTKIYYVQFVNGINGQTGHLADRIRISPKPASASGDLTHGWAVTSSQEMTEGQVRELMAQHGVDYPKNRPMVYGDYSYSDPEWNVWYWQWESEPEDFLPVWMQPVWWLHSNEFRYDPSGIEMDLRDWKKLPQDLITQAEAARIMAELTTNKPLVQTVNQAIRHGHLRGYPNPDPMAQYERQEAILVSEKQVRELWKRKEAAGK